MKKDKSYIVGAICSAAAVSGLTTTAMAGITLHTSRISNWDGDGSGGGTPASTGSINGELNAVLTSYDFGVANPNLATYSFTATHPEYILTFNVNAQSAINPIAIHPTGADDLRVTGGGFTDRETFSFSLTDIVVTDVPGGFPNPTLNSANLSRLTLAAANGATDRGVISGGTPGPLIWTDLNNGPVVAGEGIINGSLLYDVYDGNPRSSLLLPGITTPQFGIGANAGAFPMNLGGLQYAGGDWRIEALDVQLAVNIPEPSRAVLLMLGGCGLLLHRRRRLS